jgi:CAAX protease family protein
VLPFPAVSLATIPWDFALILLLLATVVPWRGAVRINRLLRKPGLSSADRLSLYASTIFFQWIIVAIVAWRSASRMMSAEELGLEARDRWRVAFISIILTGILSASQVVSLRKITKMPEGQRGSLFAITEKIMPRTPVETCVYAGLALTAGISEEFLYRGFVFAAFARMFANCGSSGAAAAALSAAWFSLAHVYQGRRGVITTCVVGIIFASARIWSQSLIPPAIAHFGVDLAAGLCVSRFLRSA